MQSKKFKIMLGGLAALLVILACSLTSTVTPLAPLPTDTPAPQVPSATALPVPATSVPTDTTSPIPATVPPTTFPLPEVTSPSISLLAMQDTNNGWALTDTSVLRSLDGGTTWYDASPAGLSASPASSFFLDANNAWVAIMGTDPTNGTLYHTNDGGVNWTSNPVPFGGGSLHFVDPLNGWELIGLNAGMSHESVAIFRSADGGATWSRVFINEPAVPGTSDSLPLVGDKNGITALDVNHGWVTGSQPSDDFIYVYTSQDGGATWVHQALSIPPGYSPSQTGANLPSFFGANDAVLPVLLFSNSNSADFYVSHDAGQTWSATTPVPQGGFLAVGLPSDFFVWDGGAPLYVSHDGGTSWSSLTPNINIKDNMISLQFVNASTGWALTYDNNNHNNLYQTLDGGLTWNALIP